MVSVPSEVVTGGACYHLQDAMIKSFFSFSSIRVFVLIKSVQDMKNLDADVASVQHGNVRFANLGNDACSM